MLNPDLDFADLAYQFAKDQRLRLPNLLEEDRAQELSAVLRDKVQYGLMVGVGGVGKVLREDELRQMPPQEKQALHDQLIREARQGQGFSYAGHFLSDTPFPELQAFFTEWNEEPVLNAIRQLTGEVDIKYADAQATQYTNGHFLTRHRDDPEGETRKLAYVISLSPNWHPDWGGLLQFFEEDGTPRDAWMPGFNTLSIFAVHHIHSVTMVTPFAGGPRLSITGWFRA